MGKWKNDFNGNVIEDMLDGCDLVCVNDGRATIIDLAKGKFSALDLTIVTGNLARRCVWDILDQHLIGSDHFPITCKIGIDLDVNVEERMPRWKLKTADWA